MDNRCGGVGSLTKTEHSFDTRIFCRKINKSRINENVKWYLNRSLFGENNYWLILYKFRYELHSMANTLTYFVA